MNNLMDFAGYKAKINYDSEIELFRGEFVGLNGSADFYAKSIDELRQEGDISLKVFLEMCAEQGIEPVKSYSGRFNIRLEPELHRAAAMAAAANDQSLNEWVAETIKSASNL